MPRKTSVVAEAAAMTARRGMGATAEASRTIKMSVRVAAVPAEELNRQQFEVYDCGWLEAIPQP
jgi:hypothetical protein